MNPDGVDDVGGGVREDGHRDDADGEQRRRRRRDQPQHARPQPPHREPDERCPRRARATAMSADLPPGAGRRARREGCRERGDEEHDRGVVEARLRLEHPRDAAAAAARGAAPRRRPRHRSRRARRPRGRRSYHDQTAARAPRRPTTSDRHGDPDGGEHRGRGDRAPDAGPLRRQPTLDEDEDERGVPEHLGQLLVVVADAEAGLAEDQADAEVDEQRGQAGPHRQAHRRHRDDEDEAADEQGDA